MSDLPRGIVRRVARGAMGLAKAATGVDRPPADVIAARLKTCGECEQGEGRTLCGLCSCVIAAKVRVAGEACPEAKWSAVPPTSPTPQPPRRRRA